MSKPNQPTLPIPSPLRGIEVGSFAHYTVTYRMPAIARRVIQENHFPAYINEKLNNLASELASGDLQLLVNDTGVDVSAWSKYLAPHTGKRWVEIPWFLAETYFYRLLLQITGYFLPGEWQGVDPFALQKHQGLEISCDSIIAVCTQVNRWLQLSEDNSTAVLALLDFALWGNRVDLSLWSAFEENRSSFDIQTQRSHILVNHAPQVVELLTRQTATNIDFIADNAGFELICDLCLIDFLLGSGVVNQVNLHLKPHPTFVSDATIADIDETQQWLAATNHPEALSFSQRLQAYLNSGQLKLFRDYFWTSPLAFWELPPRLHQQLADSNLIVVKGDANYRRLLGDCHWGYSTNLTDVLAYLPAPTLALRTLKSEVAIGIPPKIVTKVAAADSSWLTNGQWGVMQFVP